MSQPLPLARLYNLGRLPQTGDSVAVTATEAEREALAHWVGLMRVEKLDATIALKKLSPTRFVLEGKLAADLVQACVVTLEPVPAHIEREFTRELRFTGPPRRGRVPPADEVVVTLDEEAPEEIENLHYDLAGPVLEEFSLALDPYPRAPGAAFEAPAEPPGPPGNPFAALRRLKSGP